MCPTRIRKNYSYLSHLKDYLGEEELAGIHSVLYTMLPGAVANGLILYHSGERWKEALVVMVTTNAVSGLYEIGRRLHDKRINPQIPVWEDVEE